MRSNLFGILVAAVVAFSAPARADCTGPAATRGDIMYNDTYDTMQFCNGTAWISMGGAAALIELDPEVGTLTASKWCAANAGGTAIDCTQNAPGGGGFTTCTTVTASGAGLPTANCAAGWTVTGGGSSGCNTGEGQAASISSYPDGNGWTSGCSIFTSTTTYARCCQ